MSFTQQVAAVVASIGDAFGAVKQLVDIHKTSSDHDQRYDTKPQVTAKVSAAEARANSLTETRYEQALGNIVLTRPKIATETATVDSMKGQEQSFSQVFNSWLRFSRSPASLGNNANPGELDSWSYDEPTDSISCLINSTTYIGFISPNKFEDYVFEAKISSTSADDDWISLVAAYAEDGQGGAYTLDVVRALNGDAPFQIAVNFRSLNQRIIHNVYDGLEWADGSVATGPVASGLGGWSSVPNGCLIKITREGDILTIETSQTDTDVYHEPAKRIIDLASDPDLSVFRGPKQYGFGCISQPSSTWNILAKPTTLEDIIDIESQTLWYYSDGVWVSEPLDFESAGVTPLRHYYNKDTLRVFFVDQDYNVISLYPQEDLGGPETTVLYQRSTGGPDKPTLNFYDQKGMYSIKVLTATSAVRWLTLHADPSLLAVGESISATIPVGIGTSDTGYLAVSITLIAAASAEISARQLQWGSNVIQTIPVEQVAITK